MPTAVFITLMVVGNVALQIDEAGAGCALESQVKKALAARGVAVVSTGSERLQLARIGSGFKLRWKGEDRVLGDVSCGEAASLAAAIVSGAAVTSPDPTLSQVDPPVKGMSPAPPGEPQQAGSVLPGSKAAAPRRPGSPASHQPLAVKPEKELPARASAPRRPSRVEGGDLAVPSQAHAPLGRARTDEVPTSADQQSINGHHPPVPEPATPPVTDPPTLASEPNHTGRGSRSAVDFTRPQDPLRQRPPLGDTPQVATPDLGAVGRMTSELSAPPPPLGSTAAEGGAQVTARDPGAWELPPASEPSGSAGQGKGGSPPVKEQATVEAEVASSESPNREPLLKLEGVGVSVAGGAWVTSQLRVSPSVMVEFAVRLAPIFLAVRAEGSWPQSQPVDVGGATLGTLTDAALSVQGEVGTCFGRRVSLCGAVSAGSRILYASAERAEGQRLYRTTSLWTAVPVAGLALGLRWFVTRGIALELRANPFLALREASASVEGTSALVKTGPEGTISIGLVWAGVGEAR